MRFSQPQQQPMIAEIIMKTETPAETKSGIPSWTTGNALYSDRAANSHLMTCSIGSISKVNVLIVQFGSKYLVLSFLGCALYKWSMANEYVVMKTAPDMASSFVTGM